MVDMLFCAQICGSEERIAVLPDGYHPQREVRCIVPLLVKSDPNEPSSDYVA